jgi:hypothetical protein
MAKADLNTPNTWKRTESVMAKPDLKGAVLAVSKMPERKSTALVLTAGSVIYTLAYFRNEEESKRFLDWVDANEGLRIHRGVDE